VLVQVEKMHMDRWTAAHNIIHGAAFCLDPETGWEVGQVKAFDKKGPHAGMFSVKYKDDPNYYTHSLLREDYGKDKNWVLLVFQGKKVSKFAQSVVLERLC
jgi:hypothetical protein